MDEKQDIRKSLITVETAIKLAKVSAYALQHSANDITPKEIEKEMLLHCERYDEEIVSILLKAYEKGEKKKC